MSSIKLILYSSILCVILSFIVCDRCCEINSQKQPQYRLTKSNVRSTQPIISRKEVRDLNECKEFAASMKALAFNFGNNYDVKNVYNRAEDGRLKRKICQALQCPEEKNFTTVVRDRNYKYYSMYPSNVSTDVGTLACVPRAGIFVFLSNSLNYTQARTSCQNMNGSLAHIINEERTNGLAKYILQDTPTFIGLSNRDDERIWKNEFGTCLKFSRNEKSIMKYTLTKAILDKLLIKIDPLVVSIDEPLSCFEYRAWGKGEPSHSRGCVSLVRPSELDSEPFWKVVPCYIKLNFICEISPISRSTWRSSNDIEDHYSK